MHGRVASLPLRLAAPVLTFDDGPGPSTPALLDVLKARGWQATFFLLGAQIARSPQVAERIAREGHVLGNHTQTHARPGTLSEYTLLEEIAATDAQIAHAYAGAGMRVPAVVPVRLPYGVQIASETGVDPRLAVLARLGRPHVGWTLMLDDWQRPAPGACALVAAMQAHHAAQYALGEPAVFCLHDGSRHGESRPATVTAVARFLDALG